MTRKPQRPARSPAKNARKKLARRPAAPAVKADPFDAFIAASARTLNLPVKKPWVPAIKANLRITLQHAAQVAEFELPDDAEPAPVFRA